MLIQKLGSKSGPGEPLVAKGKMEASSNNELGLVIISQYTAWIKKKKTDE